MLGKLGIWNLHDVSYSENYCPPTGVASRSLYQGFMLMSLTAETLFNEKFTAIRWYKTGSICFSAISFNRLKCQRRRLDFFILSLEASWNLSSLTDLIGTNSKLLYKPVKLVRLVIFLGKTSFGDGAAKVVGYWKTPKSHFRSKNKGNLTKDYCLKDKGYLFIYLFIFIYLPDVNKNRKTKAFRLGKWVWRE